jgi:gliding motility associated protien GldN
MKTIQSRLVLAASLFSLMGNVAMAQGSGSSTTDMPTTIPSASTSVNEHWSPSLTKDGVIDRVPHVSMPIPYQPIREADVLWKKRVWREIDTREKQNEVFRYPGDENTGGGLFIEIIVDALKKGKIKAYSNFDDRFTTALTKDALIEIVSGKTDTITVTDENGNDIKKVIHKDFNPDVVTKYRLKEDWIFDRNLGKMVVRIVGLAPYQDIPNEDGSYRGSQAMFWLYYPDIRGLLAQYEVFNPDNDVDRMTWEEWFEGRHFSSRIIKVSNPFDQNFRDAGLNNMEALYEGQRTADQIFNKEHDMWVY